MFVAGVRNYCTRQPAVKVFLQAQVIVMLSSQKEVEFSLI